MRCRRTCRVRFRTLPKEYPRNRLGLARWLLLPDHPLTARVTVNRFWQEVFGRGLVDTPADFGTTGQMPSHPELLDWLAVEFRESRLGREEAVQADGHLGDVPAVGRRDAEKAGERPANRLLSRGPRFRMDAEMVRDYALAASGLLVQKIGGPSVKPYQPPGIWEAIAMDGSDTRSYVQDTGEDLYRRSLYTFWKRMAPPASLDIFNAPSREFCVVRRERANTPLQALVTLNDPQFVEAARHLAEQAIDKGGEKPRIGCSLMGIHLLVAEFRSGGSAILQSHSGEQLTAFYRNPEAAKQLLE